MNRNAFTAEHMDELRRLEEEGHTCASYAIQEIEQLNEYTYALEYTLMHVTRNETRGLIEAIRGKFAPDVILPDVPESELWAS